MKGERLGLLIQAVWTQWVLELNHEDHHRVAHEDPTLDLWVIKDEDLKIMKQ